MYPLGRYTGVVSSHSDAHFPKSCSSRSEIDIVKINDIKYRMFYDNI